jgi:hypothetical protein
MLAFKLYYNRFVDCDNIAAIYVKEIGLAFHCDVMLVACDFVKHGTCKIVEQPVNTNAGSLFKTELKALFYEMLTMQRLFDTAEKEGTV